MAIYEHLSRQRGEALEGFAFEKITVGSATTTGSGGTANLTEATFMVTGGYADRAVITVSGGAIRYLYDGTVPTTAQGLYADDLDVIKLEGWRNLQNLKIVRNSATAADPEPVLNVLYERAVINR